MGFGSNFTSFFDDAPDPATSNNVLPSINDRIQMEARHMADEEDRSHPGGLGSVIFSYCSHSSSRQVVLLLFCVDVDYRHVHGHVHSLKVHM